MDTDTPRTDEALSLHYSEGDYFGEETTKEAYEFARELERELNEMTAKQNADELICWLEHRGYGWSLDHTGRMIEARIWDWPNVIGRYRPNSVEPLADMIRGAMRTMTRDQLCKTNASVGAPSK